MSSADVPDKNRITPKPKPKVAKEQGIVAGAAPKKDNAVPKKDGAAPKKEAAKKEAASKKEARREAGKRPGVWGIDLGQCALKAIRLEVEDGEIKATAFDYI